LMSLLGCRRSTSSLSRLRRKVPLRDMRMGIDVEPGGPRNYRSAKVKGVRLFAVLWLHVPSLIFTVPLRDPASWKLWRRWRRLRGVMLGHDGRRMCTIERLGTRTMDERIGSGRGETG
jgi:hypothetical protein